MTTATVEQPTVVQRALASLRSPEVWPRAVAYAGIVLAILGLWIALPPWTVRSVIPPLLLCLAAVAAGVVALTKGAKTQGWWAITAAVLCIWIAYQATRAELDTLDGIVSAGLFSAMLRAGAPLTLAALGGLFSERSGVVNIGLEGAMLFGAFFGLVAADKLGNWTGGLAAALLIGALVGLIHALFCVHMQADQIVVGTAINILAFGLTAFLFRRVYGFEGSPPDVSRVPEISIPGLREIPVIGELNLMIWIAILFTIASWFVLWRTPIGLRIRSVGEHPRAAETVGIDVYGIRYLAVVVSGMLAALGGAYLSIGFVGSFSENMTAGQGFIALAVMILGKWRPFPILASAMLFGLASALADRLGGVGISPDLIKGLPYAVTLIALVGFIGRATPPAADGRPYARGGH